MKKTIAISFLLLLAIAGYLFFNRDEEIIPVPAVVEMNKKHTQDVRSYLDARISDLSSEKEVLGGKFYITEWSDVYDPTTRKGFGTVHYEDGHNAYAADFTYIINAEGGIEMTTFEVRK